MTNPLSLMTLVLLALLLGALFLLSPALASGAVLSSQSGEGSPIVGPRDERFSDRCWCHCALCGEGVRFLREAAPHCPPVSKPASSPGHPSNPRTSAHSYTPPASSR